MEAKYKLDDCDIMEINGHFLLVYDDGVDPRQKVLVMANSPELFNIHAIDIFGADDWMEFLFYMYDEFVDEANTIGKLLDDMHDNHYDTYETVHGKIHGYGDGEHGCLTMKVVRTDENGHRWATFDKESVEALDDGILYALAEDMDIPNPDLKSRLELVNAICAEESDIDSDEYDCTDDCDGDCDCCKYADMDDRNKDETALPDFHDTGEHDKTGRSIYKYDRNEIKKLTCDQLCDLAYALDVEVDDIAEREDLIDALCNLICLVDNGHDDRPRQVVSKDDVECDEAIQDVPQSDAPQYESVNGPQHYNGTECIENMRKLYGDEAVRWFCICNAYKYRFREGNKPGAPAAVDENKARWYENYAAKMMSEQRYY